MGPYKCVAENCGKSTLNDSHLCDEHESEEDQEPTEAEIQAAIDFGKTAEQHLR